MPPTWLVAKLSLMYTQNHLSICLSRGTLDAARVFANIVCSITMIRIEVHSIKPGFYTMLCSDLRYSEPLNMFMVGTSFSAGFH